MTCVYVIGIDGDKSCVKVGISDNVFARVESLQGANPRKLIIHSYYDLPNRKYAQNVERLVHDSLKDFRLKGEWFSIDKDYAHLWVITSIFDEAGLPRTPIMETMKDGFGWIGHFSVQPDGRISFLEAA